VFVHANVCACMTGGDILQPTCHRLLVSQDLLLCSLYTVTFHWLYVEQVSSDMVKVLVSHVSLFDGPILYDDTVKMLFVDYSFLDLPIKETETPCSLAKPTTPDKNIMFHFSKRQSALFQILFIS